MQPAGEDMRIRSLAHLARALGRSETLSRLIEIAAEEARVAIDAASVSVSRLIPGSLTIRTVINVGDLGPHRDPLARGRDLRDARVREPRAGPRRAADLDRRRHRASSQPAEVGAAPLARQGILDRRPDRGGRSLWGEFYATRHVDQMAFDRNDELLPRGAHRDPRRCDLPLAARGVARAARLPRPVDRAAPTVAPSTSTPPGSSTSPSGTPARSPSSPSTSTGSRRSTTPWATSPATSSSNPWPVPCSTPSTGSPAASWRASAATSSPSSSAARTPAWWSRSPTRCASAPGSSGRAPASPAAPRRPCCPPAPAPDPSVLFAAADRAQYVAKHGPALVHRDVGGLRAPVRCGSG